MKVIFKELGPQKFSKIVEVTTIAGFKDILEFFAIEIKPHLPVKGEFELIPTDGLPDLLSHQYIVVHTDSRYVTRSMGQVVVYP